MRWALVLWAKVLLSRLNIPYSAWRKLGLFRHGQMDTHHYALKIFNLHAERAFGAGPPQLKGKTILEVGPGDSVASALIGHAYGAEHIYLVDAGAFATRDVTFYRTLAAQLAAAGLGVPDMTAAQSFEDVLRLCRAEYLTDGLKNISGIAAGSVDYIWSHSVLEHIPKNELKPMIFEFRRILRSGGTMSHNVDFQDHLQYGLNNLRFKESLWESPLFTRAGFYTNRFRAPDVHGMIREAGFTVVTEGFGRWPSLPTPREKLDPAFASLSEDCLLIRTSHVLAIAAPNA